MQHPVADRRRGVRFRTRPARARNGRAYHGRYPALQVVSTGNYTDTVSSDRQFLAGPESARSRKIRTSVRAGSASSFSPFALCAPPVARADADFGVSPTTVRLSNAAPSSPSRSRTRGPCPCAFRRTASPGSRRWMNSNRAHPRGQPAGLSGGVCCSPVSSGLWCASAPRPRARRTSAPSAWPLRHFRWTPRRKTTGAKSLSLTCARQRSNFSRAPHGEDRRRRRGCRRAQEQTDVHRAQRRNERHFFAEKLTSP